MRITTVVLLFRPCSVLCVVGRTHLAPNPHIVRALLIAALRARSMALTWAMCTGFGAGLPYIYPVFFVTMITHRYLR